MAYAFRREANAPMASRRRVRPFDVTVTLAPFASEPQAGQASKGLRAMPKEAIHPSYNEINVKCACGSVFQTRSTHKGDIVLEICAACHPFFTGKQKLIDTAGRVDRVPAQVRAVGFGQGGSS